MICDVPSSSSSLEDLLGWVSKLGNSKPYLILNISRDSEINFSKLIHYGIDEFLYNDSQDEKFDQDLNSLNQAKEEDYLTKNFLNFVVIEKDTKVYSSNHLRLCLSFRIDREKL